MNSFERWSVRSASLAVVVTGFALLWFQYGVDSPDPFAVVNHPLQSWALKGHVLAAPLFLLAIGFIAVRHIWRHIVRRVRPGRRSGLWAVLALVPMVASGYGLQVVVAERLHRALIAVHIASSVVFTIAVGFHFVLMWRYVRAARDETFGARIRTMEGSGLEARDGDADREGRRSDRRPEPLSREAKR